MIFNSIGSLRFYWPAFSPGKIIFNPFAGLEVKEALCSISFGSCFVLKANSLAPFLDLTCGFEVARVAMTLNTERALRQDFPE